MKRPAFVILCALACGVTVTSSALGARRHRMLRHASAVTAETVPEVRPQAGRQPEGRMPEVRPQAGRQPEGRMPEVRPQAAPTHHRWVVPHLPRGGALEGGAVVHHAERGDSVASIAESYLDLTNTWDVGDLTKAILADNPQARRGVTPGMELRIPRILEQAPKHGAEERIGLPKDGVLKGIYVRGTTAGGRGFPALLERVAAHGMNAIVLDVKDYDGLLTYPSKVPLAVESGAVEKAPIRSYARAVRFAHERGVRVIARVSCFNDQLMAKAHPGMAIRGVSGHPYRKGWLDPKSDRAQAYVADLVRESIDAGADEIQLDYVRFPVLGMKNIDFGLDTKKDPTAKVDVITSFVERIHQITRHHGVPLSLDVFGVIAFGKRVDIENLGQDPNVLAKHSEFLSAMVYPSHYDPGFMGYEQPGDHPELVGMGVKHMIADMDEAGVSGSRAKIRPWLQAMRHKSSNYGAGYIQDEIRTGDKAGGSGWLLWNPGQVYDVTWRAVPRAKPAAKHGR
jgi:hypothetical protein